MNNYEIETNSNNQVTRIMQTVPYKRVYPYKRVGDTMVKQTNVNINTLKSGLKRGNWGLY